MDLYELALGIEKQRIRHALTGRLTPWYLSAAALALGICAMRFAHVPILQYDASEHLTLTAAALALFCALALSIAAFCLCFRIRHLVRRRFLGMTAWCMLWFSFGMALMAPEPHRLPPIDEPCLIEARALTGKQPGDASVTLEVNHWRCSKKAADNTRFHTRMRLTEDELLERGDVIRVAGRFDTPQHADTPGAFDARAWLQTQNIALTFKRKGRFDKDHAVYDPIERLPQTASWLRRPIDALRLSSHEALSPYTPYGVTPALSLGVSKTLDPRARQAFATLGIAHVLAVSGLHFGLIAVALTWLLSHAMNRFPRLLRKYGRKYTVSILSLALLWLYILIVGAPISAQRALLMLYACLIGRLFSRKPESLRNCALASTIILVLDPRALFAPSFQLSFGAVLGIFCALDLFQRPASLWLRKHVRNERKRKCCDAVCSTLIMTFGSTLTTAPFCIWHFGQLPLLGALANIVAIPFVSFIMLPLSLIAAVTSHIPHAGGFFAQLSGSIESGFVASMIWFAEHIPLACVKLAPHPLVIAVFALLTITVLLCSAPTRFRRIAAKISASVATAVILVSLFRPAFWFQTPDLRMTFISMGQADATFIEFPDHTTMLIDAGNELNATYDMGSARVVPYLQYLGVDHIDIVVLTHGDYDHYAAMQSVFENVSVGAFWYNGEHETSQSYTALLETLKKQGVEPTDVRSLPKTTCFHSACLERLWPDSAVSWTPDSKNDRSIVFRLTHDAFSALLMGDAGLEIEDFLSQKYGAHLDSTLLKAGHHGSRYATGQDWLSLTTPQFVVFSAGKNNRYHFPNADTLKRCSASRATILRTDTHGTLRVTSDGRFAKIETAL